MYRMIILPDAKEDIKEAALWYNSRKKGLGKRFTTQIRITVNLVKKNPYAFPIRFNQNRTIVVEIFPFMVHYSIIEDQKLAIISAVFHTSRNPDIWIKRNENIDDA